MKQTISRRTFLKRTAAASLSSVAAPYFVPSSTLGKDGSVAPSRRIVMGGIGLGGQGTRDMQNFMGQKEVQFVAVCDVMPDRLQAAKDLVNANYGNQDCAAYKDFRDLLARKDIDAVLIATGDRWHPLISIEAARAGKDVYCEKPMSLTIAESRAVADTMKRYGTVYQCGTQRRSMESFAFAVQLARSGKLGKLHTLHAYLNRGPVTENLPPQPVPEGFDWEMWLGPAPYVDYNPQITSWLWNWNYNYGGGAMTDWGSHCNDLCQWANGTDLAGPVEYEGWAKFPADGFCNTPTDFNVVATYPDGVKLIMHDKGGSLGVKFEGDEGWVYVDDNGNAETEPKSLLQNRKFAKLGWTDLANWTGHHGNFLQCVKTRSNPIAWAEVAHRSATTGHIANICVRLGRKLRWDVQTERFINDEEANRMLYRAMRSPWQL